MNTTMIFGGWATSLLHLTNSIGSFHRILRLYISKRQIPNHFYCLCNEISTYTKTTGTIPPKTNRITELLLLCSRRKLYLYARVTQPKRSSRFLRFYRACDTVSSINSARKLGLSFGSQISLSFFNAHVKPSRCRVIRVQWSIPIVHGNYLLSHSLQRVRGFECYKYCENNAPGRMV